MYENNTYPVSAGVSLAKSAQSVGNSTAPRDAPASHIHTERLFASLGELHQLTLRLGNSADRISGSVPEAAGAGRDAPPPNNLQERLDYAAAVFQQQLGMLRQEIERIERFV